VPQHALRFSAVASNLSFPFRILNMVGTQPVICIHPSPIMFVLNRPSARSRASIRGRAFTKTTLMSVKVGHGWGPSFKGLKEKKTAPMATLRVCVAKGEGLSKSEVIRVAGWMNRNVYKKLINQGE
jgi:hypothetical protein